MADLQQILTDVESSNSEVRKNAEAKLQQVCTTNLAVYCNALKQELCNNNRPDQIRQMAGLCLKNAISSTNRKTDVICRARWVNDLADTDRSGIKQELLNLITSDVSTEVARRTACQVIAKIARLEVPQNNWMEFYVAVQSCVGNPNVAVRIAGHIVLAFFTEDVQAICDECGQDIINDECKAFVLQHLCMGLTDTDSNVRLAALKGFASAILFAERFMQIEGDRRQILNILGDSLASPNEVIELAAWEVMFQIVSRYYNVLDDVLPGILQLSYERLQNQAKVNVAISVVEFWSAICDEELLIMEGSGSYEMQHYIAKYKDQILPMIFEACARQDEDICEDEWTVNMAAGALVGLCAQVLQNAILPSALSFVDANFDSKDWQRREAAIMVYGSILFGHSSDYFAPILHKSLPYICTALNDPAIPVRDTCAWAICQAAQYHIAVVSPFLPPNPPNPGLLQMLLAKLDDVPRVAKNACGALYVIFQGYKNCTDSINLDANFTDIADALIRVTRRQDASEFQLRVNAYHALYMLISQSGSDNVRPLSILCNQFVEWLNCLQKQPFTEEVGELQSLMIACMNPLLEKLGMALKAQGKTIVTCFRNTVSSGTVMTNGEVMRWSPATEEVFLSLQKLNLAIGVEFVSLVPDLLPMLSAAVQARHNDPQVAGVAIELMGSVCVSCNTHMASFISKFDEILFSVLLDQNSPMVLKPKVMLALADMAITNPEDFLPHLKTYVEFLSLAAYTNVAQGPQDDIEWSSYIPLLREATLEGFSAACMCVQSVRSDDSDKNHKFTTAVQILESVIGRMCDLIAAVLKEATDENLVRQAVKLLQDQATVFRTDFVEQLKATPIRSLLHDRANAAKEPLTRTAIDELEQCMQRVSF